MTTTQAKILVEDERKKATLRGDLRMPFEGYYFHPAHSWAKVEDDGTVRIGADDVLQRRMGDITHVELPPVNEDVIRGKPCVRITDCERRIHKLIAPVSGRVVEVNSTLQSTTSVINDDPYGAGWMVRVEPSNIEADLSALLYDRPVIEWWAEREAAGGHAGECIVGAGLDPGFKYEIAREPGGEHIKTCFACGACTATCPVREIEERYNPRRIIRMALLGMREEVLSSDFIWLCSTCYCCSERCPQDVKFTEIINAIRNIAAREGYAHPGLRTQAELIGKHGVLYEIDEFDNKKRESLGLPRIHSHPEDVRSIFKMTGLGLG